MRKLFITIALAAFAFSAYAKDIQELVVTTNPPMHCQNCENKIKSNLRFEKGIKKIQTNVPEQKVTIEFDAEKTDALKIENAFSKIGYQVTVINQENQCPPSAENCE